MSGSPSPSRSCPGSPRLEECRRLTFPTFMEAVIADVPEGNAGIIGGLANATRQLAVEPLRPHLRQPPAEQFMALAEVRQGVGNPLGNVVPATRPRRPSLPAGPRTTPEPPAVVGHG
jgi:hypothetical protein